MENKSVPKYTVSFGLSLAICSVVNALLVIAKEKSPALQAELKKLTGHHWISHSAIVILLFITLGWLLAQAKGRAGFPMTLNTLTKIIVAGIILSGLLITGFYLIAD
jgi:hypothetical protein